MIPTRRYPTRTAAVGGKRNFRLFQALVGRNARVPDFCLLLFQQRQPLREAQVIGNAVKIPGDLSGIHIEILEEKDFSREPHHEVAEYPVAVGEFALFQQNPAALVKVSQNAPTEGYVFLQSA